MKDKTFVCPYCKVESKRKFIKQKTCGSTECKKLHRKKTLEKKNTEIFTHCQRVGCGKKLIYGQTKYCSRKCYAEAKINEDKKRIMFTNCQNPECGKELNHIVKRGKGNNRGSYFRADMKYCDRVCAGKHKSVLTKGQVSNFQIGKDQIARLEDSAPVVLDSLYTFNQDEYGVIYD